MKKYQVGIIGYGDFTKVMLEHLSPYADIVVSSRSKESGEAGHGASFAPISEVLARPIIIPSIPSQYFEDFFTSHRDQVNPEALVTDVCSVKVKPLAVLEAVLPSTCGIIGTHPLFGPASIAANGGITGLRCVVSNVRSSDNQYETLKNLISETLGLQVLERTPEEHDREMAYVQGLSHYIARVMDAMDIPESELSTLAYDDLLDMKKVQAQDSWDLFESIMHENPFAQEVNQQFKAAQVKLDTTMETDKPVT